MACAPSLRRDLQVSHAFINMLLSVYQGRYVFNSALGWLRGAADPDTHVRDSVAVIRRINLWWTRFLERRPLFRLAEKPALNSDATAAQSLLHVYELRARSLCSQLQAHQGVDELRRDRHARNLRAAALCEIRSASEHHLRGCVSWGTVMNELDVAERHRPLVERAAAALLSRQIFECLAGASARSCDDVVEELWDESLLAPELIRARLLDVRHVVSMYTGRFDYADAGVPVAESVGWEEAGLSPYDAGQWVAFGADVSTAVSWIQAGVSEAVLAASYFRRGFEPSAAGPWLAQGIDGGEAVRQRDGQPSGEA